MIDLSDKTYLHLKTARGRTLFLVTHKDDDAVEIAMAATRALEQIESHPGQMADLTKHGVVSIALGLDALTEAQSTLQDLL